MVLTLTVPDRYPLVLLAAIGTTWLTSWQTNVVYKLRKKSGIDYPRAYAEKAEAETSMDAMKFNCAQRAHQNTLETLPQIILQVLFAGLRYPEISAGLGAAWIAGRVVYTLGYATGDPKKRLRGAPAFFASLGIHLLGSWTAAKLILETCNMV